MRRPVAREVSRLPCVRGQGSISGASIGGGTMNLIIGMTTPMKASTNPAGADRTLAGARLAPPNPPADCPPAM